MKIGKLERKLNAALNCKGGEAFEDDSSKYEDDIHVYDFDNGIQERGGYMRMNLFDLLRWHVPRYENRYEILSRLVKFNKVMFSDYEEHVGKDDYDVTEAGGTNTPIAFHSQILLALLICNLYHDYPVTCIVMVSGFMIFFT